MLDLPVVRKCKCVAASDRLNFEFEFEFFNFEPTVSVGWVMGMAGVNLEYTKTGIAHC